MAFSLDPGFDRLFLLEQIKRHVMKDDQIFSAITFAHSAAVFSEINIETPV